MVHSVDLFDAIRFGGRLSDVLLPGTHVLEDDRVVFGVEIRFHGNQPREAGGENARSPGGVKKLSPSLALLFGLNDEQTWPCPRLGGADEDCVASPAQIENDGL